MGVWLIIDAFQFGDGDTLAFPMMTGAGRYHTHCCGGVENMHAGEETTRGVNNYPWKVILFISWVFLMHASALTKTGFVVNKFICCSTGLLECRIELQCAAPNCGRWSGPSSTPARQRLVATEVSQWVAFAPSSLLHWIDGVLLLDDAWIIRSAFVCGRFNSMLISFKKATDGDLVSSSE